MAEQRKEKKSTAAAIFDAMGPGGGLSQTYLLGLPQGYYEPDWLYKGRTEVLNGANAAVQGVGQLAGSAANAIFASPALRDAQNLTPPSITVKLPPVSGTAFPKSYADPAYDQAEAYASKLTGVPQQLLRSIRLNGERSNADQVSSAGARTPYQIIPKTAAGIQKNYGIDPMSSVQNAALSAAYVLREQAGNPGPGQWTPQLMARAAGGYFGGAKGAANPFGGLSDGGTTVGQYTQRVLNGSTALSGPYVNPFDPGYANQALGQIDKAAALQKMPFSASADIGPMPEPPAPTPTPKTNFSQADADLQALKPAEVTAKEEHDIKWKNLWAGLGRAMQTMPEGAGVGDFFLRLGGGILAGKAAGMDEIQQKQDQYSTQLAKWQAAVYEHDFQKAQIQQNELMRDWQANQNWAMEKYKNGLAVWTSNAKPALVGNNIVFTRTTPEGKVSVQGIPIPQMVDADAALKKASIYSGMFSAENSANSQVTGVENQVQSQIALAKAGQVLSADSGASDQEKAAAAAYAPVQAASFAISSGQVDAVLGPDEAEALSKDVQKKLVAQGIYPGSTDYADAFQKMATQQLAMAAFASPQLLNKLSQLSPAAQLFENYAAQQKAKQTTQVTTDSKGRRTVSSTTTAPATGPDPLDVFASNLSNQQYSDVGPYKRY